MHSKCTSVKGSYHFGDPLWPLEISTFFFFPSRWVVEYYVQNTGFDFSSNTDSKAGASPLRGVGCIPPDSAQPQNDPLCKFSMQLCRIWFLLKMFLNTFKIWAGSDCSAPMPGTGIGNGCSKPKGQHGPRPWERAYEQLELEGPLMRGWWRVDTGQTGPGEPFCDTLSQEPTEGF